MKYYISGNFERKSIFEATGGDTLTKASHVFARMMRTLIVTLLEKQSCLDINISVEPDTRGVKTKEDK